VRRRIILAILMVTALAEVLFALPLAITIQRRLADQDQLELTQLAALAANRVADGHLVLASVPKPEREQQLGLYGPNGRRLDGTGPDQAGTPTADALTDRVMHTRTDGWLVVTVPVIEGGMVQGLVRTSEPLSAGASRARVVWLQLAALAAAALVLSAVAASTLGRRLTRPLESLGRDAARIGEGDFTVKAAQTGLREIDSVGRDLSRTADRVSSLFAREQAFTADASHQLRSPLTGLRLTLEAELAYPRPDHREAIAQALADVERLEKTIDDLLNLARDTATPRAAVDLSEILDDIEHRWHETFARGGRRLVVSSATEVSAPTISSAALTHVLRGDLHRTRQQVRETVVPRWGWDGAVKRQLELLAITADELRP